MNKSCLVFLSMIINLVLAASGCQIVGDIPGEEAAGMACLWDNDNDGFGAYASEDEMGFLTDLRDFDLIEVSECRDRAANGQRLIWAQTDRIDPDDSDACVIPSQTGWFQDICDGSGNGDDDDDDDAAGDDDDDDDDSSPGNNPDEKELTISWNLGINAPELWIEGRIYGHPYMDSWGLLASRSDSATVSVTIPDVDRDMWIEFNATGDMNGDGDGWDAGIDRWSCTTEADGDVVTIGQLTLRYEGELLHELDDSDTVDNGNYGDGANWRFRVQDID